MNARQENIKKLCSQIPCGVGNISNEFWKQISFSFGLVFYTRIIGLSNAQAGWIFAVGQIIALLSTAMFGYLCDSVDVPCISRRFGRRKTWHLLTTIFLVLGVILSFSRCFTCNESTSSWVKWVYFVILYGMADFMYGASEMAHLSIIPVVSKTQDDVVIINSLR